MSDHVLLCMHGSVHGGAMLDATLELAPGHGSHTPIIHGEAKQFPGLVLQASGRFGAFNSNWSRAPRV